MCDGEESERARGVRGAPTYDGSEEAYEGWLVDVGDWLLCTNVNHNRQGIELRRALKGHPKVIAAGVGQAELTQEEMVEGASVGIEGHIPRGVLTLIQAIIEGGARGNPEDRRDKAWNDFISLERGNRAMTTYTQDFVMRLKQLTTGETNLDDDLMARHMLRQAQIPAGDKPAVLTQSKPTEGQSCTMAMRSALNRLYADPGSLSRKAQVMEARVDGAVQADFPGAPGLTCFRCGAAGHRAEWCAAPLPNRDCPKSVPRNNNRAANNNNIVLAYDVLEVLGGEVTLNYGQGRIEAVLDTGCQSTVIGSGLFEQLVGKGEVKKVGDQTTFVFGVTPRSPLFRAEVPVWVAGSAAVLTMHVFKDTDRRLPLLLSKEAMGRLGVEIHLGTGQGKVKGRPVKFGGVGEKGHLTLPIELRGESKGERIQVLAAETEQAELRKHIVGLHRNWAHPSLERALRTLRDRTDFEESHAAMMKEVTGSCAVCKLTSKPRAHPKVAVPLTREANQVVGIDLALIRGSWVLKMVCTHSRYTRAGVVADKSASELVRVLTREWVSCVGAPNEAFLADPGERTRLTSRGG